MSPPLGATVYTHLFGCYLNPDKTSFRKVIRLVLYLKNLTFCLKIFSNRQYSVVYMVIRKYPPHKIVGKISLYGIRREFDF